MESAATEDFDLSFFEDEDILALAPPSRLVKLGIKLWMEALPAVPDRVAEVAQDADLDNEPDSHFENFTNGLDILEGLAGLDGSAELIDSGRKAIAEAVTELERQREAEDDPDHTGEWDYMSSSSRRPAVQSVQPTFGQTSKRSVFDDVDR